MAAINDRSVQALMYVNGTYETEQEGMKRHQELMVLEWKNKKCI